MSENLVDGDYGTSRARNGMPGSCPKVYLYLLYLDVKYIMSIHRELRITGIKLKTFDDRNLVRMRSTLFEIKGNVNKKKGTQGDGLR